MYQECKEQVDLLLSQKGLIYDPKYLKVQFERKLHRLVLPVNDADGNRYIFKFLLINNDLDRLNFENEKKILTVINEDLTCPFKVNTIIDFGSEPSLWLLTDFVEGQAVGNTYEFDDEHLDDALIDFFASSIKFISAISWDQEGVINPEFKINDFKKMIAYSQTNDRLAEYSSILEKMYIENLEFISDKKYYRPSHGDLTPLNVLLSDKSYSIIDWESFGKNLAGFDQAYIYQRLWRNPVYQQKFINKTLSKLDSKFQKLFWFQVLILLTVDIRTINRYFNGEISALFHGKVSDQELKNLLEIYYQNFTKTLNKHS